MPSADVAAPTALARRYERRFAVSWRNRTHQFAAPVGVLDHDEYGYRFRYLPDVADTVMQFRPFIGFPDLLRDYESPRLWPFFALRVMDRKRPDYLPYLARLGLGPDAARLDVLARSGGEQKGDSVSVIEEPKVERSGSTEATFLVRGMRYAVKQHDSVVAVERLLASDRLNIVDDVGNVANDGALLLAAPDGAAVGWVPDLLVGYARRVRGGAGGATVLQNNGPETPWHMRLLVRLSGTVDPTTPGLFSGEGWPARRGAPAPVH